MRLQQRLLNSDLLTKGTASLEILEPYLDDKYLPSFLLRGECEGLVFHALIATDIATPNVRVVTMYLPSLLEWDSDGRTRRAQS